MISARNETVSSILKRGVQFLEEHNVPDARISAETLLSFLLGRPKHALYADASLDVHPGATERYGALLKQRSRRYPLQYLLGTVPFHDVVLGVDERCLIPRPETEFLVEVAVKELENSNQRLRILDVGTGSGNIAISLAAQRANLEIMATDISSDALELARENARLNQVADRVKFEEADLWPVACGNFDVLISNPPYLTHGEMDSLQPELAFEPSQALLGGADGLDFYRRIIKGASKILTSEGYMFFEVGFRQAGAVAKLLSQNGFNAIKTFNDYSGIERVVTARLGTNG